jgi:NAD(P)-dependent dehydrogenase (short-subunit alcohol dehydrogenase family)
VNYEGSVAFITGGANGAGFGQAQVFGRLGCRIFIVDIRGTALEEAVTLLRKEGIEAHGAQLDIMDREAYGRVADEVERTYGQAPRLLFNTAGVAAFGPAEASTYDDFDWVLGVNLGGVVNGMVTFVPRMIKAGTGGHVVSTASLGAFQGLEAALAYCAAKSAVVSLMEGYRAALRKFGIGVSVLCPANIRSNIALSSDTRPAHLRRTGYLVNEDTKKSLQSIYRSGMDPVTLAEHVKAGIDADALYIIPYPEAKTGLEHHFAEITASIPPLESDPEGVKKRLTAMQEWAQSAGSREMFTRKGPDAPV